jgi:hypothetical protein
MQGRRDDAACSMEGEKNTQRFLVINIVKCSLRRVSVTKDCIVVLYHFHHITICAKLRRNSVWIIT